MNKSERGFTQCGRVTKPLWFTVGLLPALINPDLCSVIYSSVLSLYYLIARWFFYDDLIESVGIG